eukprot:TRINITY_DN64574_c0_g1_i2.p1 TRINITY_DN64574_c0_g1~~TRINITY_DN64574_c0_g1_i2.p1  ORF type:complete len:312 (+),score=23.34 TRINITY_DN64574_c0_g1_i2:92-937(+)
MKIQAKQSVADAFELDSERLTELFFQFLPKAEQLLQSCFSPDLVNLDFTTDDHGCLSIDLVPRYQAPQTIQGHTFVDKEFGHNFMRADTSTNNHSAAVHTAIVQALTTATQSRATTTQPSPQVNEQLERFLQKVQSRTVSKFSHWTVYMDIKQQFVGRVFALANRPTAVSLWRLTDVEKQEFVDVVLPTVKQILKLAMSPDRIDMAFLGNDMHHCHAHFVPRYKKAVEIVVGEAVVSISDPNFNGHYSCEAARKFVSSPETSDAIFSKLLEAACSVGPCLL